MNSENDHVELTDQVLEESVQDSQYRHEILDTETEQEKAYQAHLENLEIQKQKEEDARFAQERAEQSKIQQQSGEESTTMQ